MTLLGRTLRLLLSRRSRPAARVGSRKRRLVDNGALDEVRVHTCRIEDCRGVCCARGVTISAAEASRIRDILRREPRRFDALPRGVELLVPRDRLGQPGAYSTEVVSGTERGRRGLHASRLAGDPPGPADWPGMHCVFRFEDGRCSLQAAAVELGEHKWQYKPSACWLFPLRPRVERVSADEIVVSLEHAGSAKALFRGYPCGRIDPTGQPAREALAEELRHFARTKAGVASGQPDAPGLGEP